MVLLSLYGKIIAKLQKNHYSEKYLLVVWINLLNFEAK